MNKKINLEEILKGKHPTFQTAKLKVKLLKSGMKSNICEECGQTEIWNGKYLVMHLDHINGKSDDHRIENLKMLCPNCHSQTETYAGKNKCNDKRLKSEEKKKLRKFSVSKNKHKIKGIEVDYPNFENYYGLDLKLSEELAKQIDAEILKSLGIKSRNGRRMDKIKRIFND